MLCLGDILGDCVVIGACAEFELLDQVYQVLFFGEQLVGNAGFFWIRILMLVGHWSEKKIRERWGGEPCLDWRDHGYGKKEVKKASELSKGGISKLIGWLYRELGEPKLERWIWKGNGDEGW